MALTDAADLRDQISDAIKDRLKNGHKDIKDLEVMFSRQTSGKDHKGFFNVYFLAADVTHSRARREDDGRLVVRIALREAVDVDRKLNALGRHVETALGSEREALGGLVDTFELSRWEFGAPEQATVSFLALIYTVKFETEE